MNWKDKNLQRLVQVVQQLESARDVQAFLRDLMTEGELVEFSRRLQAADMLAQGYSYRLVQQESALSSATVARVSKWLNGSEGGYRTALKKLHHNKPT